MRRLFGTDGVRGVANTTLSALLALKLGSASAYVLRKRHEGAKILVGRDPRISGDILESALASGICSMGVDVYLTGVVPTPAVAFMTQMINADAGVVISASHNPMQDNGIKFFGGDGYKLADEVEAEIEKQVRNFDTLPRPKGAGVGRMYRTHALMDGYMDHLQRIFPHRLDGMKIALDCANGATHEAAPKLFAALGADLILTNCEPDGLNINRDSGSLHPEMLQELVVKSRASLGLAFDGDGDRAILVDEKGSIVDGDHIMAIAGLHLTAKGELPGNAVVATVMSNMGLEVALRKANISLIRMKVGDRYVSDEMRKSGIVVGGEKSGHLIFSRYTTTGDGLVTSLQMLEVMLETGQPLSVLAGEMQEYPQVLINVPVRSKEGWDKNPDITQAIREGEVQLGGRGRILVRASGTENLIRVMAEGPDQSELEAIADKIRATVRETLG